MAGLRLDVNIELGLSSYHLAALGIDPDASSVAEQQAAWQRSARSGSSTASTTASTSRCCGRPSMPRSVLVPTSSAAPW